MSAIAFGVSVMTVTVISFERQGGGLYVELPLIFFKVAVILLASIFLSASIFCLLKFINYTLSEDLASKHTARDETQAQDEGK